MLPPRLGGALLPLRDSLVLERKSTGTHHFQRPTLFRERCEEREGTNKVLQFLCLALRQ